MSLTHELFVQMLFALGVGLLIGLERAMQFTSSSSDEDGGRADDDADFAGLRTFAILALTGFAAALISDELPLVAPAALIGVSALVVGMYMRSPGGMPGITTEVAAIGCFGLGMLCHHHPHAAVVLALGVTVLLAFKRFVHTTIRKVRRVELIDTLKFLVVILVVLPLLPDRALDPYDAFNPHKVGLLVVLISGISFVGYFLTRFLGAQKGLGLTGIVGGLTSSTAVTAAMAAEARGAEHLRSICAFSTVAANATMFVRVIVVVAVLDRALMMRLLWPLGAMAAAAAVASVILWVMASRAGEKGGAGQGSVELKNPFSIGPALKFAGFFVVILFVARLATMYFGDSGLYAAATLSGLADVDAITLSIAEQTKAAALDHRVGAIAITIAVVSNGFVKIGIALYSGGWKFGRLVGICLGAATLIGLAVAIVA
jgi:uncharacterized membrane protein (DUF4010 family)